jgi:hypothetical protein
MTDYVHITPYDREEWRAEIFRTWGSTTTPAAPRDE